MADCVFCKIISGEYTSSKVYEDETILVFMDTQPVNKGHLLIVPKKHIELAAELDDETSSKMMILASRFNNALRRTDVELEGINYFLADGASAGQEVPHTHLHLIPRFKGDGFGFVFPEGYRVNLPEREELDSIAEKIKNFI
ncbi:MAG: HIT family protein [Ignavibacteria bacterium]|nr:HIT family protein [Ignavibacteria bacterium]MCC7159668.1 HIT family protein [Ignavibacteria bacterium]